MADAVGLGGPTPWTTSACTPTLALLNAAFPRTGIMSASACLISMAMSAYTG